MFIIKQRKLAMRCAMEIPYLTKRYHTEEEMENLSLDTEAFSGLKSTAIVRNKARHCFSGKAIERSTSRRRRRIQT